MNWSRSNAVCGACGYLGVSGEMALPIAIHARTDTNRMLYVQAAAGIVAETTANMPGVCVVGSPV
jgi:anthranilate/para-aminobenzoate synthase component I